MKKKFFFLTFCLGMMGTCLVAEEADQLEGLINQEKSTYEEWTAETEAESLPATFLLGDENRVELYSDRTYDGKPNLICDPLPFDELAALSEGQKFPDETVLNLKIPRVREKLSDACLTRPDDPLLAIGPGSNTLVSIKEFVVKKGPACAKQSAYSLWAQLSTPLITAPFFFSTDVQLPLGNNGYAPFSRVAVSTLPASLIGQLKEKVPFAHQYESKVFYLSAANFDGLVFLKKKEVSLDDVGLANEVVLWFKNDHLEELVEEKVKSEGRSGHLKIIGTLDYNDDQKLDLILQGDQNTCVYEVLFKGLEVGLQLEETPIPTCSCG